MHRKLKALAALAAFTLAALATGGTSARADEPLWPSRGPHGSGVAPVGWVDDCAGRGGGTDCATAVNHYPQHYGEYRHYRGGHRYHRRHWGPRHHRRHQDWGIHVRPIVPHVAPRYRHAPDVGLSRAHIVWCHDRYRSYRAWDNTFQPYHGPRQQCWSPYN